MSTERALWLANAVLPHEPALRRWLERKSIRGIEVDDVVQETYAILARLASVAEIRDPKAYIYRTAYSVVLIYLRRARVVSIQTVADVERFDPPDDAPSPEQIVSDREELHRLGVALAALPARCREVFVLRKIRGLSQRQVAAELGIAEKTVEKQVHKGLGILTNLLGRGGNSPPPASLGESGSRRFELDDHGTAGVERRN